MQVDLRLCWSHIPHCWKSHAAAQIRVKDVIKISNVKTYKIELVFMNKPNENVS